MCFYLTPTAWRKAQIDNRHAWLEQTIFVIDLKKLEGRSAFQSLDFGLPREAVGRLPTKPLIRRCAPTLGE
jgi:hypothetical protein